MLDSLIFATAFMASQGYGMPSTPSTPPPNLRPAQSAPNTRAAAPPPQPAVAAVPGKTLRDLPKVTIRYFDVSGKNLKEINKSIERSQKPDSSGRVAVAPTGYGIDATFSKATGNGQCRITSAMASFSATVALPRLVPHRAHTPALVAGWQAYLAGIENSQAATLWFVYDRLREVENAILASSCEGARSAGAAAVERIKAQAAEFERANSNAPQAAK